jgi:hypothetical protein
MRAALFGGAENGRRKNLIRRLQGKLAVGFFSGRFFNLRA